MGPAPIPEREPKVVKHIVDDRTVRTQERGGRGGAKAMKLVVGENISIENFG